MQERRWLGGDEARRLRDALLADALPILRAGPRNVNIGGLLLEAPFVQLDPRDRPDVADLFRVVADEGTQARMMSAIRYLLLGNMGFMEINVVLTDPVDCRFKFVLEWPARREIFDLMLIQGRLYFSTGDLNFRQDTSTLGLQISREELQPNLDLWRRASASQTRRDE